MTLKKSFLPNLALISFVLLFGKYSHALICGEILKGTERTIRLPTLDPRASAVLETSPGDIVEFEDGAKYPILKVISLEGADGIFLIPNNRVLRVSKDDSGTAQTVNQYIDGYSELVRHGIPVPKIIEYVRGQRVIVEKIDIEFHLEDLFSRKAPIEPLNLEQIKSEFMAFVAKFRDFNFVADMHSGQIVYARKRGWMLLDWRDHHYLGNRVNPFILTWTYMLQGYHRYNLEMLESWQRSSDDAIALSRGHNPSVYHRMTFTEARKLVDNL